MWRAKYKAEKHHRTLADGSEVEDLVPSGRNYSLLQYIGAVPRTSYLARVKNPNPQMPDAKYRGLATVHAG
jgi:hypothetical protein